MSDATKVKVIVAFAPNGENEGKTVEMDVNEAREAVREGRVRYADEEPTTKGKKADASS